jgi:hypothetical protein
MENIEKVLFPNSGKLIVSDGIAQATIVDEDIDELHCTFNNDGCVEIDTEGHTYITLSRQNLKQLKKLIDEAEKYYERSEVGEDMLS